MKLKLTGLQRVLLLLAIGAAIADLAALSRRAFGDTPLCPCQEPDNSLCPDNLNEQEYWDGGSTEDCETREDSESCTSGPHISFNDGFGQQFAAGTYATPQQTACFEETFCRWNGFGAGCVSTMTDDGPTTSTSFVSNPCPVGSYCIAGAFQVRHRADREPPDILSPITLAFSAGEHGRLVMMADGTERSFAN